MGSRPLSITGHPCHSRALTDRRSEWLKCVEMFDPVTDGELGHWLSKPEDYSVRTKCL